MNVDRIPCGTVTTCCGKPHPRHVGFTLLGHPFDVVQYLIKYSQHFAALSDVPDVGGTMAIVSHCYLLTVSAHLRSYSIVKIGKFEEKQ